MPPPSPQVKSLQSTIDLVAKSLKQGALSPSIKQQALGTLKEATGVLCGRGPGGDLRRFCKPRNPLLLRFLLGDRTDVVAYRTEHLMQMKSEYHTFRDRAALLMLAAPGLLWLSLKRAQTLRAHPSGSGPAIAAYSFTPPILTGVQVFICMHAARIPGGPCLCHRPRRAPRRAPNLVPAWQQRWMQHGAAARARIAVQL